MSEPCETCGGSGTEKIVSENDCTLVWCRACRDRQGRPLNDAVNAPPHYLAGGIETIDFIEAKELNYRVGNAVKYIARHRLKGAPVEDLRKAVWYLEREIARLEDEG